MVIKHLDLMHRKSLSARVVYFLSTAGLEGQFQESPANVTLDSLRGELLNLIDQSEHLVNDLVPLDRFLIKLFEAFETYARSKLEGKDPELLGELLARINSNTSKISCDRCYLQRGTSRDKVDDKIIICNGGPNDKIIIDEGGLCISKFKEMFDIAYKVSRNYYSRYGDASIIKNNPPKAKFYINFFNDKPHKFPVDYYVTGATSYLDSQSTKQSDVILTVAVRQFDDQTYLATLYTIFHECIAHVFHGITGGSRCIPKETDRYAEGWMDWVVFKVLEELLMTRKGPARHIAKKIEYALAHFDHARNFHSARVNYRYYSAKSKVDSLVQYQRNVAFRLSDGRLAAYKTFNLMQKRRKLCSNPLKAFLKLSFDLNMLNDFSEQKRESFVAVMNHLDDHEDLKNIHDPHHLQIAGLLTDYLKKRDTQDFLGRILELEKSL